MPTKKEIDAAVRAKAEELDPTPPNAVLVIREISPEGGISVTVQVLGDVRVTEAHTILRLAAKHVSETLHLEE